MFFLRGSGSVVGSKANGGGGSSAGGKGPAGSQTKDPASSKGPGSGGSSQPKDPASSKDPANGEEAGSNAAGESGSEAAANEAGIIEIVLQDPDGKPYAGAKYRVDVEKGSPIEGTLDTDGYAKVEGVGKKACTVSFPDLNPE